MFWRRRFSRLRKDFQVTYRVVDEEAFDRTPINTLALNISAGGVCFEATTRLSADVLVALEIRADDLPAPILALARVVWCQPGPGSYEIGAAFWWMGWADRQERTPLASYVAPQTVPAVVSLLD